MEVGNSHSLSMFEPFQKNIKKRILVRTHSQLEDSEFYIRGWEKMKPLNEIVYKEKPEECTQKKIDLVEASNRFKRLWKSDNVGKLNTELKINTGDLCGSNTSPVKVFYEIYKKQKLWEGNDVDNSDIGIENVDDNYKFGKNQEEKRTWCDVKLMNATHRFARLWTSKADENSNIQVKDVYDGHYCDTNQEEIRTWSNLNFFEGGTKLGSECKTKDVDSSCSSVENDDERHYCNSCPKFYRSKYYLKVHMKKIHGVVPHMCRFCNKVSSTLESFKLHLSSHTDCNSCAVCGKIYKHKSSLIKHLKVHSELKQEVM